MMYSAGFTFARALGQAEIMYPQCQIEVRDRREPHGLGPGARTRAPIGSSPWKLYDFMAF